VSAIIKEVLEIVDNLPGILSSEVRALMPHESRMNVDRTLSYLSLRGRLRREGRVPYKHFPADAAAKPDKVARVAPLASDKINDLERQLRELQAWKQEALARFPDLAVEPIIFRARAIAAQAAPEQIDAINKGHRDNSALIKAVVIALSEQAA